MNRPAFTRNQPWLKDLWVGYDSRVTKGLCVSYLPCIQSLREKTMEDWMLHGRFVPWWLMVNHSWL